MKDLKVNINDAIKFLEEAVKYAVHDLDKDYDDVPDSNRDVLLYINGDAYVGYYSEKSDEFLVRNPIGTYEEINEEVTAWRELPDENELRL